jgi:hypothetical protein
LGSVTIRHRWWFVAGVTLVIVGALIILAVAFTILWRVAVG